HRTHRHWRHDDAHDGGHENAKHAPRLVGERFRVWTEPKDQRNNNGNAEAERHFVPVLSGRGIDTLLRRRSVRLRLARCAYGIGRHNMAPVVKIFLLVQDLGADISLPAVVERKPSAKSHLSNWL